MHTNTYMSILSGLKKKTQIMAHVIVIVTIYGVRNASAEKLYM